MLKLPQTAKNQYLTKINLPGDCIRIFELQTRRKSLKKLILAVQANIEKLSKNCTFFFQIFLDHCVLIGKINISNSSSTNKIWKGESAAALLRLKKMFVWNSQRWFTDLLITFLAPRCEDEDERHLTELWRDYGAAAGLAPTKNFGFMPCPRGDSLL